MTSRIVLAQWLSVVLFLSPIAWAEPDAIEFPEGKTEVKIPLLRAYDLLLVPLRIDGTNEGLFILDTGSPGLLVDTAFAKTANLPAIGDSIANGSPAGLHAVTEVDMAGVKLRHIVAHAVDLSNIRDEIGVKQLQGCIGGSAFKDAAFSINWAQRNLTLYKVAPAAPVGDARVRLWFPDFVPTMSVTLDKGSPGWFVIDTGATLGFRLEPGYVRSNQQWLAPLPSQPELSFTAEVARSGPVQNRVVQLKDAQLAGISLPECSLEYPGEPKGNAASLTAGTIGLDVLRYLEMIFDYKASLAWFRRDPNNGVPAEWSDPNFDPRVADLAGYTPLMRAASMGRTEDVRRFLAAGAPPDAKFNGGTALHSASGIANLEIARALISAGAPINAATRYGSRPLLPAAGAGNAEMVKLLLENGARMDAQDIAGRTPLILAAAYGSQEVVAMLIKAGADINVVSAAWGSALDAAAVNGRTEVAKLLLENGANVNLTDRGKTPLLVHAAFGGSAELVRLLLDRGLDPNAANGLGETPLMGAVVHGHVDVVKLLLDHGADRAIENKQKHTAITFAISWGQDECARVLYFYHTSPTSKPAAGGQ